MTYYHCRISYQIKNFSVSLYRQTMNLHLGQAFNSHLPIHATSYAGTIYLSFSGFLSLLQTQLGLAYPEVSHNTRLIQYLGCLHKKDKTSRFYHRSLQVDDLAVANKLLNWRDELYLAGWTGQFKQSNSIKASNRLNDIAKVEKLAIKSVSPNEGQYIADVLEKLSRYKTQIDTIFLYDEINSLPKQWQSVLFNLEAQGIKLHSLPQSTLQTFSTPRAKTKEKNDLKNLQQYLTNFNKNQSTPSSKKSLSLKGDGSVLVIKAQSKTNSAQLISDYLSQSVEKSESTPAHKRKESCIILAESQETTLEQLFVKYDFARQGYSNASHARSLLQLLPLTLQLLWQPIDINKLLSFLVHPVNVLPAFACSLLADNISSYPGIGGQHWNETIDKIREKAKVFNKTEDEIDDLIEQINYWICSDSFDPEEGSPLSVIEERTENIYQYLQGHILFLRKKISETELNEQEIQLAEADISLSYTASEHCSQLIELIQLLSLQESSQISAEGIKIISQLKLTQLINAVMGAGASLPIHKKEVNAPLLINDPALVIDTVDELIWWDMSLSEMVHRSPWTQSENQWLKNQSVKLVDPFEQLKQQEEKALQALLNIKKRLIIVLHTGEEHHSLWDKISTLSHGWSTINLEQSLQNSQRKTIPWLNLKKVSQANKTLPIRKRWWELKNGDQLTKRDVESFSGLDTFINSPYQWVLNYKAKLNAGNILNISEGNQLKGTMTHELFEQFFNEYENTWSGLTPAKIKKWFNKNFDLLIQHQAATFLEPGKLSEQEEFRETVFQALIKLIAHLRSAKIKSIKMEDRNEERFFAGKIMGFIDMLLTNDNGEEIVLDLKWGSEPYKTADLEKNLHIQLAIYSYMRKKQTKAKLWPDQAYFIIQTGNLLAQNNFSFPNAKVSAPMEGESAATLWKQLENSYKWRREQLDKGWIEMTIGGTEPDDNDSIPPENALSIKDTSDHFNDYETLMGWGK